MQISVSRVRDLSPAVITPNLHSKPFAFSYTMSEEILNVHGAMVAHRPVFGSIVPPGLARPVVCSDQLQGRGMPAQLGGVHRRAFVGDPSHEDSNQSSILAIIRHKFEDYGMRGQGQKTIRQKCFAPCFMAYALSSGQTRP